MTNFERQDAQPGDTHQGDSAAPGRCAHCGGTIDPALAPSRTCPHCGGPLGASSAGSHVVTYEDRTTVCLPYELERIARAEAVDGWRLVDTTVSSAVPGMIEVHFRRPMHVSPPPPATAPQAQSAEKAPRQTKRTRPDHKPPPTAKANPEDEQGLTPAQIKRLMFFALVAVGTVWATDRFGLVGLLLAIWLLPQLFRGLKGSGSKRKRRRRRRKP